MARPRKAGLSYFPLDSDIFADKDIRALISRFGSEGFTIYAYILCAIYRDEGYYLVIDDDFEHFTADDVKSSRESVKLVLKYLFGRSLLVKRTLSADPTCKSSKFAEPVNIITSAGIQRRYQLAVSERARKTTVEVDGRIWILEEEETLPSIKVTGREGFSGKNSDYSGKNSDYSGKNAGKKIKENKRKEEKNIYTPSADDVWIEQPDVNAAFIRYLNIRAGGGTLMRQQVEALREQLLAMSSEPAEQVRIIDQSTRGGYKMFYPLGGNGGGKLPAKRMTGVDGFRNVEQRTYDFQALERQLLGGAGS